MSKIRTRIQLLDKELDGGISVGKCTFVEGYRTITAGMLAALVSISGAKADMCTALLSEDATVDDMLTYLGTTLGLGVESSMSIPDKDTHAGRLSRKRLAKEMHELNLYVFDVESDPAPTVKSVAKYLEEKSEGADRLLVVDSERIVRAFMAEDDCQDVADCIEASRKYGFTTLVICGSWEPWPDPD